MRISILLLLFYFSSCFLFSMEFENIQAYKKAHKALKSSSKKEIIQPIKNIIITFNQKHNHTNRQITIQDLSHNYPLKFKKCIVKRICFFEVLSIRERESFFETLKNTYPQIEHIQENTKREFSRY